MGLTELAVIRFIEVINQTTFNPRMERTASPRFSMGEIWINPKYVVSVREAPGYKSLLREGSLPLDLNEAHTFTTVVVTQAGTTASHVVVGSPQAIAQRLKTPIANLLKG